MVHLSHFLIVKHLKEQTSSHACTALFECVELQGLSNKLISKNGPCLSSLEVKEFCAGLNIVHIRVSPYQHQGNSTVDRISQTVKAFMRKERLPVGIGLTLLNYRSTPLDANATWQIYVHNLHVLYRNMVAYMPAH